jgi:hypothetical protein
LIQFNEKSCVEALNYAKGIIADRGGTKLFDVLNNLFSQRLSFLNQSKKVIILTDGRAFDKEEVFNLMKIF